MPRYRSYFILALLACTACKQGTIETSVDGAADATDSDGAIPPDVGLLDLPSNPYDPCVDKCADTLLCIAGQCHRVCSTGCGDKAPECEGVEGCHVMTSFSSVCMAGQAKYGEKCGGGTGVRCEAGNLCVTWSGRPAKCFKLCKYGCPDGVNCGTTYDGCDVCIE